MNTVFRLAVTLAVGAVAMYYLDPNAGRRRRALVRDRAVAAGHEAEHFARVSARRAGGRVHGILARTRAKFSHESVADDVLRDRIRSRLGHLLEHPSAVDVAVYDGRVRLRGSALRDEIDDLVATVSTTPGVAGVVSELTATTPARH